jgi:hypothetical protein
VYFFKFTSKNMTARDQLLHSIDVLVAVNANENEAVTTRRIESLMKIVHNCQDVDVKIKALKALVKVSISTRNYGVAEQYMLDNKDIVQNHDFLQFKTKLYDSLVDEDLRKLLEEIQQDPLKTNIGLKIANVASNDRELVLLQYIRDMKLQYDRTINLITNIESYSDIDAVDEDPLEKGMLPMLAQYREYCSRMTHPTQINLPFTLKYEIKCNSIPLCALNLEHDYIATGHNNELNIWQIIDGKPILFRSMKIIHNKNSTKVVEMSQVWNIGRLCDDMIIVATQNLEGFYVINWRLGYLACSVKSGCITKGGRNIKGFGNTYAGAYVVCGCENGMVQIWEIALQKKYNPILVKELCGHKNSVRCIEEHAAMNLLLTGGDDQIIHAWDLRSDKPKCMIHAHKSSIISLVNINDDQFASGGLDSMIFIHKLTNNGRSHQVLRVLNGFDFVYSLISIKCSEISVLLSVSKDNTIRGWHTNSGECLFAKQDSNDTSGMIVVKNGVLSYSSDGFLKIWSSN